MQGAQTRLQVLVKQSSRKLKTCKYVHMLYMNHGTQIKTHAQGQVDTNTQICLAHEHKHIHEDTQIKKRIKLD